MRLLAVAFATAAVLGAATPVAGAPAPAPGPDPTPPDRHAPRLLPPPEEFGGCVVPISSPLLPCPGERPRRPAVSCVVPVHDLGTLTIPCPPSAPDPEGRTVPAQSASEE